MKASAAPGMHPALNEEAPDFSLVLGGPLFQLLVRSHLATPALEFVTRRIVIISLIAWLPLLLLSLIDGKAWGNTGLPFLHDIEMHARFLVTLPLLIAAELLVHQRLRMVVGQFVERSIITEAILPKFRELVASAMKLRNSSAIELILFLAVVFGGYYLWSTVSGLVKVDPNAGNWYATATADGYRLTPAGYWYLFVSRTVFQFIVIRWYFRLFIWARFLWQTSRLELALIPAHPDKAAGLGFLAMSTQSFAPLLVAHGALLAGLMANPILFGGAKLTDFSVEIGGVVVLLLLVVLGPLLVFSPAMAVAKRNGLREYGALASRTVQAFDRRWLPVGAAANPSPATNGDAPSVFEAGKNLDLVRDIQPFPFGRDTIIQLVVFILIPVAPLALTMVPLNELVPKLLKMVF